jgi:LL-diaminopimelate aminotransferase
MIKVVKAKRIKELPPYLFATIDKIKAEQLAKGVDVIDLTVGDPDLPTPEPIIACMKDALDNPEHHRYPSYEGMLSLRTAVAEWYKTRFRVPLDPQKEVIILIGSKEGIAHIPMAFVEEDHYGLVPDPGYPVYGTSIMFAGGTPHYMPLLRENRFLPDFDSIPPEVAQKATLMFFNYPNNPTAAIADEAFFESVVSFCEKHNIIACHDAAYTEVYFEGEKPSSFMEVAGARDVGIEFHSLSKTFNMTGWRLAFAVGNADVIAGLGQIKTNIDSGVFQAIQEAGILALTQGMNIPDSLRETYRERRDILVSGLQGMGLDVEPPAATFYIWAPIPKGFTSMEFTAHVLDKTGVLTTPGNGFGPSGEGYIRFSLTAPTDRINEAVERLKTMSL